MSLTENIRAALRTVLETVTVATVTQSDIAIVESVAGELSIDRVTGSWLDDKFSEGDEVTLSGFGNPLNEDFVSAMAVTAGSIIVRQPTTLVAEAAGASVTVAVRRPSQVAMENRGSREGSGAFVGKAGFPWYAERYAGAGSLPVSIGPPLRVRHDGLYYVDLFYPLGIGTLAMDRMADAIIEAFYPGRQSTYGGQTVTIRSANRQAAFRTSTAMQCPITIATRTHTLNPV